MHPSLRSRTFQKFAVRSSAAVEDLAKKGVQHKETFSSQGGDFFRVFKEEVRGCVEACRDARGDAPHRAAGACVRLPAAVVRV